MSPPGDDLDRLGRPGLDLGELMTLVKRLEAASPERAPIAFGVSANVTVDLLEPHLRRRALLDGRRAVVHMGSYGDHLGNARQFREAGVDALVLLGFFDNLLPALEARIPTLPSAELDALRDRVRDELRLVLEEARTIGRVYLCLHHRWSQPSATDLHGRLDAAVEGFNQMLRALAAAHPNVRLVSPADVVARLSWEQAFSPRFYFRYKAPYTSAFFEALARELSVASRNGGAHFYKVLALDADNTLWGGIVGEDQVEGLKLGPFDYPGNVYWLAQQELLALQRQGVLLCLCSKNEPADVEAVLAKHPHMVLRREHFAASQVNWDDKATNLRRLAAALNIGLDAVVFLDDSAFECEAVRGQLPMVRTLQVPARVHEYPALLHELKELFLGGGVSAASLAKTEQYRLRALAEEERGRFASQEEYLASLGLRVEVRRSERQAIGRIAELSQKSNQFNLTTRRYTDGEVAELMDSRDAEVYSVHVRDRFGDSGLTGVAVLRYREGEVGVEAFLLSCRVIGRGVEHALWKGLLDHAAERGARRVVAEYLPTAKNAQVKDFYDRLGIPLASEQAGRRAYAGAIAELALPPTPHIEVIHVF